MPFGAMYGALFFMVLALWLVLGAADRAGVPGLLLAAGAGATAVGLLLRHGFARFGGAAIGVLVAVWTARLFLIAPGPAPVLFFVGSLTCALLLLLPVTGRGEPGRPSALGRATGLIAAAGATGFAVGSFWLSPEPPGAPVRRPAAGRADLARAATPSRVHWTDFGSGLALAASEGKPLVVTFVADWCGYCQKMDRTTWTEPRLIEKLADVVAVRVDVDETAPRNGYAGADLAGRYAVRGTPAVLLIDADGRAVARADGYRDAAETRAWLEGALRRFGKPPSGDAVEATSH